MDGATRHDDDLHTLARWPGDRALAAPDRIAVDDGARPLSYAELDARAERLAAVFAAAGCRPGDRIATLTGNSADHVVAFFGCARSRLVIVPLSWRLAAGELAAQLAHADAALLLVEPAFEELADAALAELGRPLRTARLGADGVESWPATGTAHRVRDDDPLLMLYTSGTSGRPKAVVLTHANCFWTNLSLSRQVPVTDDDVVLAVLPQFHVGGWNTQPLLAWWVGATVLLERGFDSGRVLQLIEGRRVTAMMGVPTIYLFLAGHPAFARTDLSSLRHALVGGAPMPESLLHTWHARGVLLAQGYGLSEAAPNVLCLPDEQAHRRLGFAGRPYPYVEAAVADPDTGDRIEGPARGELLVRGPNVFAGYWRDPDATAAALRDGWLHTGDVVLRDAEGYYRIVDRLDDMFISGGENVSPSEVENALYRHPAVSEAAVVGQPDERWGHVGVGYVVLHPDHPVAAAELIEHCRQELAGYKVPREIHLVAELPHSAVGKLLRRQLRPAPDRPAPDIRSPA